MAYVNKETKKIIVEAVKAVLPKGWKATYAVRHHSTLVMTIRKAPVDLIAEINEVSGSNYSPEHKIDVNHYYPENIFSESLETFKAIIDALNVVNYDNSDPMTDYFDKGYYIDLNIGTYDKPFEVAA